MKADYLLWTLQAGRGCSAVIKISCLRPQVGLMTGLLFCRNAGETVAQGVFITSVDYPAVLLARE